MDDLEQPPRRFAPPLLSRRGNASPKFHLSRLPVFPLTPPAQDVSFLHTACYKLNAMPKHPYTTLSRRERQIMDILYRLGRATANEVIAELQDDKHSSTVRTQLRVLEEKGHLRHEEQ